MDGNATKNMHLTQTNYEEVESDCQNVPPTKFNTCFHTVEEIPAHESTNHLSHAKLVVAASGTSIITGEHNRAYQEDIQEEIIPHLSSLDFPAEGLFMRLDRCSPKDGRQAVPEQAADTATIAIVLMEL
ncbi:hypothetical protein RAB80_003129 [Fusarium oxysporum f. sp. vasinfectum]|uniref:Uncharacterized protein n=1 Tax=Fusarium oxysporum f. sp. vasinfectum 25433 TaxID=1089449 RepID=X0MG46_FUSOX|nr:hypothetical protein FOTG_02744 [Fusarium oxysporum f. sp. vasinfectum 25433]KAK2681336.1 hypothetical protein RAB80_003129 [Fusarium oxysporum f. sp. vasinfectum]KAK2934230.1 hypothetical protein FoTM2_005476 [Fusarium oxysporum f. sp. vasinfectum]